MLAAACLQGNHEDCPYKDACFEGNYSPALQDG